MISDILSGFSKEELIDVISSIRKIHKNYARMSDAVIVKRLLNNEVHLCDLAWFCTNKTILLEVVRITPVALEWIPEHLRSYEICFEAVKLNDGMFDKVPSEHRDLEMCLFVARARAKYKLTDKSKMPDAIYDLWIDILSGIPNHYRNFIKACLFRDWKRENTFR